MIALPNFLNAVNLNELRNKMNARLIEEFKFPTDFKQIELSGKLTSQLLDALEFKPEELSRLADRTVGFKGRRVLLYLRDSTQSSIKQYGAPKFHFAFCTKLEEMNANQTFDKYLVASREDGLFKINVIADGVAHAKYLKLDVCRYCLGLISWQGYRTDLTEEEKLHRVKSFNLKHFFNEYPANILSVQSKYNSENAPLNDYVENWGDISKSFKQRNRYSCSRCQIVLEGSLSKYLHVHHKNMIKNDNEDRNLMCLCIKCHAEQPSHDHLKNTEEYKEFIDL